MSDHKEELWMLCTMPHESWESLDKESLKIRDLSLYDIAMHNHYKTNEDWQVCDEELKAVRERKKDIEYKLKHKIKYAKDTK